MTEVGHGGEEHSTSTRCGFVAVLGQPNAGKSTLINNLVGHKVSIVSHKVQTTRQRILGITIKDQTQIILVDTPGIFEAKKRLEKAMVSAAWTAGKEADLIVVLHDASHKYTAGTEKILKELGDKRAILVLNKVDQIAKEGLLELIAYFKDYPNVDDILMTSALTGDGVSELVDYVATKLPISPWLFDAEQITDMPQRMWAAEITREKLYQQLHQELPYETYVETEAWERQKNGDIRISQVIYVSRDGQKSIILGKGGQQIKKIGNAARQEIGYYLGKNVHLFLFVKVAENWSDKPGAYRLMGLDFDV
ncbi:GTPase Era [Candidatus Paracaedibacter symbiosus]|uniref:GTPase Era n=1 Tax=Candidatus Paracaedibacter symbiosus TaxID=244582 RepID=UPI000509C2A9